MAIAYAANTAATTAASATLWRRRARGTISAKQITALMAIVTIRVTGTNMRRFSILAQQQIAQAHEFAVVAKSEFDSAAAGAAGQRYACSVAFSQTTFERALVR